MTVQIVNIGAAPDDGTGDVLRVAFDKINNNFLLLEIFTDLVDADDNFIVGSPTGWVVESGPTARASLGLIIGTDVQAYDAFLTSIAGLGTVADRMIYTTALDTAAETPLTAFARTILDDASQAATQATLALIPGADVQAWDAGLDDIAALPVTNNNFIVGDGANWVAENGATARASMGAAPNDATFITQTANGELSGEQALAALATGLVKNATGTGILSIAVEGTDFSNLPVPDTQTIIEGSADATKLMRFEVDGFTTGNTRVLTPPDADFTLAGLEVAQTFVAAQTVQGPTASTIPLIVQTTDDDATNSLMELQDSAGVYGAKFSRRGELELSGDTGTTQPFLIRTTIAGSPREIAYFDELGNLTLSKAGSSGGSLRIWRDCLISGRTTSLSGQTLLVESSLASGNATAAEFLLLAPVSLASTHIGGLFALDIRPAAGNYSGVGSGANFRIHFQNQAGSTSTGTLNGALFEYDDASLFGTIAEMNMAKWDGLRVQRAGAVITTARMAHFVGDDAGAHSGTITDFIGIDMGDVTNGVNNFAIRTNAGNVVFNEGGDANTDFRVESDTDEYNLFSDGGVDAVGIGASSPGTKLHVLKEDAVTGAITNIVTLGHNSTGTPAANFGTGFLLQGESSTTINQDMVHFASQWVTPTHATRKARGVLSAYDTAEREAIRFEASGTAAMLSFYGVTAVVRPTALTSALTQITHTGPTTPDYAIATPIDSGAGSAWGFSTQDEFETTMSVILNLQTRVDELETKLQGLGLLT